MPSLDVPTSLGGLVAEPLRVSAVLLLREEAVSRDLGASLWAGLEEIGTFFNGGSVERIRCERRYVSPLVPDGVPPGSVLTGSAYAAWERASEVWRSSRGRFTDTYDHEKLASAVRGLVGGVLETGRLLVVTDQELVPPPEWRYLIWDSSRSGHEAVVSVAPLDPEYWREPDSDRKGTVKHRVRSAALCILGEWLGLSRCSNEQCFLFRDVDSVLRLDVMIKLGAEHRLRDLSGFGFKAQAPFTEIAQVADAFPTSRATWMTFEE